MSISDINMAFYRPEDWERLISVAADKEVFHNTWEEWHESYLKTKTYMESEGFKVNDVVIDIDELIRYCFLNGIRNDGKARSQFVSKNPAKMLISPRVAETASSFFPVFDRKARSDVRK